MKREIALDTETTGLDPQSGHRIVEIGCVELMGGIRTGKTFHVYLNPERDMPEEAERVHGISSAFLKDKPVFAEKVDEFLEFIADSTLVIHNAAFDMRFINHELQRCGFPALPEGRSLDTVAMARKKFPGSPASLDALCRRFEIDLSSRTKHGALLDAELLSDVYLELLGGRQAALLLDTGKDSSSMSQGTDAGQRKQLEPRAIGLPTATELEAHMTFMSKVKDSLWEKLEEI